MGALIQLLAVLVEWARGVRLARTTIALATVLGIVAGLGSTALIAVINAVLTGEGQDWRVLAAQFAVLCVVVPASGFASGVLLLQLTAQVSNDLRLRMSRQILATPYRTLEELGAAKLLATINDDIPAVTAAITSVPALFVQLSVMAGCLVYLGWLSRPLLLLLLGYMCLGVLSYQLPVVRANKYFQLMREQWDLLFGAVQAMTEGNKELKLNRYRRHAYRTQQLEPAVEGIRRYGVAASMLTTAAANLGQILFFVFIGMTLFVSPMIVDVGKQSLIGYTLAVLYMIGPLTLILGTLPVFGRAYAASMKVKELGLSLSEQPLEPWPPTTKLKTDWSSLELKDVTFTFRGDEGDEFHVGPVNLKLEPGELVFLTGGNGSGKTTLAKVLIGLYEPDGGEMLLDGEPIDDGNRDDYRQLFSVVFYDFFLFERLFGVDEEYRETKGREYLAELQLSEKVELKGDRLSTLNLSQGQRKRLALLCAYLEDRPIYVFDEWASDQDPAFRNVFYHEILPELKSRGKTVVTITHDDRYFDLADRLVKLELGKIEYDKRLTSIEAS